MQGIDAGAAGRAAGPALTGLLLAGLLASAGAAAGDVDELAVESLTGHAFALDDGELLYRQIHDPVVEDGRLVADEVRYVDADGDTFARKTVDYSANPVRPFFRLEDQRTGYVEGLEAGADDTLVLFHRPAGGGDMVRTTLEASADLVADAGFDRLIAREFDRLLAGESVHLKFAVPGSGDWYSFRARPLGEDTVLGEPALVVRFEPAGWVGRLLSDPIDVRYHRESRGLLRYEGIANIRDETGDPYEVRIDFPPGDREPEPPG